MHHLVSGIHFWVLIYLFLISAQPHVSIFLLPEVDRVDFSEGINIPLINLERDNGRARLRWQQAAT